MKANELRIGNLVLDGKNKIIEVDSISELGINIEHGSLTLFFEPFNSFGITDNNDVIKPIPLTKEWLLKFGFLIEENGDVDFSFDFINYGLSKFEIDQKYYLHIDGNFDRTETDTRIEYVHSLQNLFFALTGEELTISNAN